jgi:predicted nucleotide-binding protein
MTKAEDLATRFEAQTLIDAFARQPLVEGKKAVALKLAMASTVLSFEPGETIIEQGDTSTDIFFLLAGSVEISPNGRSDTLRASGTHIGEMAAIDPSATRSATVHATEPTVVARVGEPDLSAIANRHPYIWRHLAREMADRLRQRVAKVAARKQLPRLFIASSKEGLKVTEAIQSALAADSIEVKPWTDEIFTAGKTNIEALEAELDRADFAALLLSPDDLVISRSKTIEAPRDNVILELGMFIGRLSRDRAFMIQPSNVSLKIPSDLLGVNPIYYNPNTLTAIAPQLRKLIASLGPR